MKEDILKALAGGRLLFDGATGTYARTISSFPEEAVERACLTAPNLIRDMHLSYIAAGARAIKTNTFAAHAGLAVENTLQQKAVIEAAYRIASEAAESSGTFVFADIGPVPANSDPRKAFSRSIDCFLACGASNFLLETLPSAQGVAEAAAYIKAKNPSAFVIVSFAVDPDGFTRSGETAASLIMQMDACGHVDAVGLNCVCGAYHMKRLLEQLPPLSKPLSAMPNAGYPQIVEGRIFYDSNPAFFAQQVFACAKAGASILGGCCGTTPAHIRETAKLLALSDGTLSVPSRILPKNHATICRSGIKQKLSAGQRPILVELDPPKNADADACIAGAKALMQAGVDAITLADCPIGRASMDSSLLAAKLHRELGVEVLPHMTCRDRNVNATKALLLGLSMEDIHNVLVVTGDPVPTGDRGSVKSVFQFNSRVLARFIRSLSDGGETAPFFLCGALNVNAVNFDSELKKAQHKEAAGIEAFLTQPVLSEQAARNIERARKVLSGAIFGGIFPVVSERNARFLHGEVAGVTVDDAVIEAYTGLDRAQGEEMALRLCRDAAARIRPFVDGYYIMTPFQRVSLVCRAAKILREL